MQKTKTKLIYLLAHMKVRIGCADIHAPDHVMKRNLIDVSYIIILKNLCMRL